jgi:hypothetical protein
MNGVTFKTMETVGERAYTFEVNSPERLASLTADLIKNLQVQGGKLTSMEVN